MSEHEQPDSEENEVDQAESVEEQDIESGEQIQEELTEDDESAPVEPGIPEETPETEEPKAGDGSSETDDTKGFVGSFQDILGRIIHKGESGFKRATDLSVPKELISYGKEQMGSLRNEVVSIVGTEVKSFLSTINLGQELVKILTYLTFEVKMQIRLVPSEKGGLRLEPKTEVKLVDKQKDKGG